MSNNFNTILAALDLAPVAIAAIAYHDAESGSESWRAARALMSNNFNTILAALDLAPVALAAIAYHDAESGSESWRLAQRLDETIVKYKEKV
jgi:hypothetical protein